MRKRHRSASEFRRAARNAGAAVLIAISLVAGGALDVLAAATTVRAAWQIIPTPLKMQADGLDCEAAALQMALAAQGISRTQDSILSAIGIDWRSPYWNATGMHWGDPYTSFVGNPNGSEWGYTGYGTYYPTIARVAQQSGATVLQAGEGISPASVYQALLNGHPAVAWVSFDWAWHQVTHYTAFDGRVVQYGRPYEHAVALVGVTDDQVLVNNPHVSQPQWIAKATFESAYATFNHMAVILGGPAVSGPQTASTVSAGSPAPPGTYHSVPPSRILDTRGASPLTGGSTLDLQVAGLGQSAPTGATAALLTVTVADTTASSYLTVYPRGIPRPGTSSLNWRAGEVRAVLVEIELGSDGAVSAYNGFGSTDVIVDLEGWVGPAAAGSLSGYFNAINPSRILDSRDGTGIGRAGPVGGGQTISLPVSGRGGLPSTGMAAVVLNLTVTGATGPGYATVFPLGLSRPLTSNLNWAAGETVADRVVVPLGASGQISLYDGGGAANFIADVSGWFTDSTNPTGGSQFVATTPQRLFDSRAGFGRFPPGGRAVITVTDPSVPRISALVLTVTASAPTAAGFLNLWPDGISRPNVSDVNFGPGSAVGNLVVVKVGSGGSIDIYNGYGLTDVVVDLAGYYS